MLSSDRSCRNPESTVLLAYATNLLDRLILNECYRLVATVVISGFASPRRLRRPRDGGWRRRFVSFLWRFLSFRVFRMSQVCTFALLLCRDLCSWLTGRYGIASHRILESGRRENESQT